MTQYASTTDLDNFGVKSAVFASVSTTKKNAALVSASRTADAYLRSRYDVPLTAWDESLTTAVVKIAQWQLMMTEGFNPEGLDEVVRLAYEDGIAYLRDLSSGRATFAVDATAPAVAATPAAASDDARGW